MTALHKRFHRQDKGNQPFLQLLSEPDTPKREPFLSDAQQAHLQDAIRQASKRRSTTLLVARCTALMSEHIATLCVDALEQHICKVDVSAMLKHTPADQLRKSISRLFADAETKNWILLFDEADALFGKRTDVKDSHDRFANQEVNHLLRRAQQSNGLIILTLNDRLPLNVSPRRFDYLL